MSDDRTQIAVRDSAINIGTELNQTYKIDALIGVGGMGEVFKGHNIQTGDPVAIKIVLPEFARDEMILELFRKEARILNHLSHDAIVRYYVFSIDRMIGRPYLAMEYVDGSSLAEHVKTTPLAESDFSGLLKRLADGLHRAHAAGVIHRDMSPDNVILPGGLVSQAKIIDFGIARSANVGGATLLGGSFAGKYNYVSPEQLGLFGGEVTPKSDIYSLALVMAAAVQGRPINMSGSQVEVIEKRRVVPDLAGIPKQFHGVLSAMLQPDPAARPADMAAVRDWTGTKPAKARADQSTKEKKRPDSGKADTTNTLSASSNPPSHAMRNAAIAAGTLAVIGVGALGGWIFVRDGAEPVAQAPIVKPQTPTPEAKVEPPAATVEAPLPPAAATPEVTPEATPESPIKTVDATTPPPPLVVDPPPQLSDIDGLRSFVSEFGSGTCFNANIETLNGDTARIAVFGSAETGQAFQAAFRTKSGIDPDIVVHPVSSEQCGFVAAVGKMSSPGSQPLAIELSRAAIRGTNVEAKKVGDGVTVRIGDVNQRNVYLFVVGPDGGIYNISRTNPQDIVMGPNEVTANLSFDNPPLGEGEEPPAFYPMLVFAVASPKPLFSINKQPAFELDDFAKPFLDELKSATGVASGMAFLKLTHGK